MKMKKKTSVMLLSAAAVAAVGVAAVSFAAWEGNSDTLLASASTGSAYLVGFTNADAIELGTLVPYDQPANTIEEGETITSALINEYVVNQDYTITVTSDTTLTLYVLIGDEQTEVPADWSTDNAGDWKLVSGEDASFAFEATTGTTVTDKYISVMLVSEDIEEMSQTFELTLTLAE